MRKSLQMKVLESPQRMLDHDLKEVIEVLNRKPKGLLYKTRRGCEVMDYLLFSALHSPTETELF